MPYCSKCGAQVAEDAKGCPSCGAPLAQPVPAPAPYVRSDGARILLLLFGAIILVGGVLFVIGSAVLLDMGSRGLRVTPTPTSSDSYAIILSDINLSIHRTTERIWMGRSLEFVSVELTGTMEDPSKSIFMGIAAASDAEEYLKEVEYDDMSHWTGFRFRPFGKSQIRVEYDRHAGGAAPQNPSDRGFWTASVHGTGLQTLEWKPETGNYWVVLMNEDGSRGIDASVVLTLEMPFLGIVGAVFLVGGIFGVAVGVFLIYYGLHRR